MLGFTPNFEHLDDELEIVASPQHIRVSKHQIKQTKQTNSHSQAQLQSIPNLNGVNFQAMIQDFLFSHRTAFFSLNSLGSDNVLLQQSNRLKFHLILVLHKICQSGGGNFEHLSDCQSRGILELVCCKKRQKKSQPRNWFGE